MKRTYKYPSTKATDRWATWTNRLTELNRAIETAATPEERAAAVAAKEEHLKS